MKLIKLYVTAVLATWLIVLSILVFTFLYTKSGDKKNRLESGYMGYAMKQSVKYTNSLINETSPYLLQHAHNPVQWNPWTEETIQKAKSLDKPIFLSIGYSACHWCHVMEKESFENEEVAAILNDNFINIKVDREERPDLDEIYMEAVQVMANNGGWPMSVFLTPELYPFYGGTYYPPDNRRGTPGFKTLILSISKLWNENRIVLTDNSRKVGDVIEQLSLNTSRPEGEPVNQSTLLKAEKQLLGLYDPEYGGFGTAPKFPHAAAIEFLLHRYFRTRDNAVLEAITRTLNGMALGGMYDHVGGGFHRYSTDSKWLVPHFEKMLYDNALISDVYLKAFQVTHNPLYKKVAQDVFEYVLRDMTGAQGGFYATQDADTNGEEGSFYLWKYREITDLLGDQDGRLFCNYYNIRPEGNFRSHEPYHIGQNIPHKNVDPSPIEYNPGISQSDLEKKIEGLSAILLGVRNKRTPPLTDDKIITAWNGLMISSLAHGYQILDAPKYLSAAQKAARFILTDMHKNGNLYHSYRNGVVKEPGFLDDYAFFAASLIDLYEATFDIQWLIEAEKLAGTMIKNFWDDTSGGFYFTSSLPKNLIVRKKSLYDGSIPSGNSAAAQLLLRLAGLFDNREYYKKAEIIVTILNNHRDVNPIAFASLLKAADLYVYQPDEIALVAAHEHDNLKNMVRAVNSSFIPNRIFAVLNGAQDNNRLAQEKIPLLKEKTAVSGKPTAYVCRNYSCTQPVTDIPALLKILSENTKNSVIN